MAAVLTQKGEEWVIDKLDEVVQTTADFVGWGTGAGTAAKGDTILFTEAAEARVTATRSQPVADKLRWVATITSLIAQTITNAGNFTLDVLGDLVCHWDHAGVPLGIGDKIEYTLNYEQT